MDAEEQIERGYRALGLGADDDVIAMFEHLGAEPASWVVYELGAFSGRRPAGDVVAMELFAGLPSHFEGSASSSAPGDEPASDAADRDRPLPRARARELGGAGAAPHSHLAHPGRARRKGGQLAGWGGAAAPGAGAGRRRPRLKARPPSFQLHHLVSSSSGCACSAK